MSHAKHRANGTHRAERTVRAERTQVVHRTSLTVVLSILVLGCPSVIAQPTGTIVADPNARQLEPIWSRNGIRAGERRYGQTVVALGDLFGTGRSAWAVTNDGGLHVYSSTTTGAGGVVLDTVPRWSYTAISGTTPCVAGDFWGTGHPALAFPGQYHLDGLNGFYFFRTESDTIDEEASARIVPARLTPPVGLFDAETMVAADLNRDGADELIALSNGTLIRSVLEQRPQLWIYQGGPGFETDSPAVILPAPSQKSGLQFVVGDFDGDTHAEIVTKEVTTEPATWLRIYWGTGRIRDYGAPGTVRAIALRGDHPTARGQLTALDCDGDGVKDLVLGGGPGAFNNAYLFRSGNGKNARTRSYARADADMVWPEKPFSTAGGYLNDATRMYEMLILHGGTPLFFSGGPDGPDATYEAWGPPDAFGGPDVSPGTFAVGGVVPLDDANGDGWCDLLASTPFHGADDRGIAAIYAGGPAIPPPHTSGVKHIAAREQNAAISLWPNPVQSELHVAWRGDLDRMPSRFGVHDALGREVASGEVEPWRGAAVWQCADVPAGVYLLAIYDGEGALITTTHVVKQ